MKITKIPWTDQLQQLLPTGMIWDYDPDTNIDGLILALQERLEVAEFDLVDLFNDLMPDSTESFLERWEKQVGLPNECSRFATFTREERGDNVVAQLAATGGQSIEYYLEVMANAGYPDNTIEEFKSLRIGDECDDFVMGPEWDFAWQINIIPQSEIGYQFNCQSECDDSLGESSGDANLKCLMLEIKPAHTFLLFNYPNA